jgi:hypothetical protein
VRRNTHSFIIRIWHEAVDDQGNALTWRGSVEHVGSGRRLHFDQVEEFVDFIRQESGLRETGPARWRRILQTWIKPQF